MDTQRLQRYLKAFDPIANSGYQRKQLVVPNNMQSFIHLDPHRAWGTYDLDVEWVRW